jgi:hypothetical protein
MAIKNMIAKKVKKEIKKVKSDFKKIKDFVDPERPKNYKPPTFKEFFAPPTKKEFIQSNSNFSKAMKDSIKNPKNKQMVKDFAVDAALTLAPYGKILKPVYKGVKSASKIMKRGK